MTPTSTVVPMGQTAAFTVNAPSGAAVEWRVNGVAGGGVSTGTIVADADPRSAVYTAPTVVGAPPPGTFEVSAAAAGEVARAPASLAYVAPTIAQVAPAVFFGGQGTITATVTGTGFTPQTEIYFASLRLPIRTARWDQITFDVSPSLLIFPGTRELRIANPAPGGGQATQAVTVVLRSVTLGNGVPADVPVLFQTAPVGTDPARLPAITYPEHNSYAPRDFPSPEVSFSHFGVHNICRLDVDGPGVDLEYFVTTTGLTMFENPRAMVDTPTWGLILASNPGFTFVFQVTCGQVASGAGPSTLVGGNVYSSTPITYTVEPFQAGGRIVYFSGLIAGLWRIEMGSFTPQATPWIGPDPAFEFQTPGCVGCHSLAPSGARMSYTTGTSQFQLANTTGGVPAPLTGLLAQSGAEWTAVHPNGRWVVGVALTGALNLYDSITGALVMTVPTNVTSRTLHTQPFWSPAGDALAFVATSQMAGGVHDVNNGEIWTVPFTGTSTTVPPTFGTPTLLVSSQNGAVNNFYPAYSPDGQWILFARAATGPSYNNPQANLHVIRANGVGGVVALGRANQTRPRNFNSWPRWAPAVQQGRYWIVYSSQRPYPPLNGTGPQQLWVTRFDPAALPADPSSPGLWLPGQAPYTGNLTAEWSISQ